MIAPLEVLAKDREMLLLAEAVGWLHDAGKCYGEFLFEQANDKPERYPGFSRRPKQADLLEGRVPDNPGMPRELRELSLLGETVPVSTLVKEGSKPGIVGDPCARPWILLALAHCHGVAHFTKEKDERDGSGKQPAARTYRASPFGFESGPLIGATLTAYFERLPLQHVRRRRSFEAYVRMAFSDALGDTRRPTNDITLWSWSSTVAAMYKAALAGALLGHKPAQLDALRWRLLAVRLDGLGVLAHVPSIPTLLERRRWIDTGLDRVAELLEVTYPLGTEAYRDENGSIFVVPDIEGLLDLRDEQGKTLEEHIQVELGFEGELAVKPALDSTRWAGNVLLQDGRLISEGRIPPVSKLLDEVPRTTADPTAVAAWWSNPRAKGAEVCIVSGVRPRGPDAEARSRGMSNEWLDRSAGRAQEWWANPEATIWMDEVADVNGRLCLIVARFEIDGWLKSEGFIGSLPVDSPESTQAPQRKVASFARLQRVWETTRSFWREVSSLSAEDEYSLGSVLNRVGPRLLIIGGYEPEPNTPDLAQRPFSFELECGGTTLSVLHVGQQAGGRHVFVTTDNLERVLRVLDIPWDERGDTRAVFERFLRPSPVAVMQPTGYGSPNMKRGTLYTAQVNTVEEGDGDGTYIPTITLFAQPRTFMALVPADRATRVAEKIVEKWQAEMGKVQNRLPLSLGLVFAGHRLPLPALLDAGRRMLRQPVPTEVWKVGAVQANGSKAELTVTRDGHCLRLAVPIRLGGDTLEDDWYPYWHVVNPGDLADTRHFVQLYRTRDLQGAEREHRRVWMHVSDLPKGQTVELVPSRFDFEYLDTAARRFEIAYDGVRRRGDRVCNRPYYVEDLQRLKELSSTLEAGLGRSQIKGLIALIEAKRKLWAERGTQELARLTRDALLQAEWKKGCRPETHRITELCEAAVSGQLADAVELFQDIPKPVNTRERAENGQGPSVTSEVESQALT